MAALLVAVLLADVAAPPTAIGAEVEQVARFVDVACRAIRQQQSVAVLERRLGRGHPTLLPRWKLDVGRGSHVRADAPKSTALTLAAVEARLGRAVISDDYISMRARAPIDDGPRDVWFDFPRTTGGCRLRVTAFGVDDGDTGRNRLTSVEIFE